MLCPGRNQALITFIRSHYPRNLIECLYKGSLREKLLTILEMEKGKASSITFLRDNALSTEPILRTKKELVSLDGRTLYWHNKDILSLQEIVENTKEDFLLKKEILKAVGLCFHEIKGIEKKNI